MGDCNDVEEFEDSDDEIGRDVSLFLSSTQTPPTSVSKLSEKELRNKTEETASGLKPSLRRKPIITDPMVLKELWELLPK